MERHALHDSLAPFRRRAAIRRAIRRLRWPLGALIMLLLLSGMVLWFSAGR